MKKFKTRGFTLVEIMVVVAIIAMLAGYAIPNYQDHVRRARRAEARAALLQAAQWLERGATATGSYPTAAQFEATSLVNVPPNSTGTQLKYRISIDRAVANNAGFQLTATPQGKQAEDKCKNLTLTHTGERGTSAGATLVAECWAS